MHCRRGVYFYTTFVFAVALALFPNWRNDGSAMRNIQGFSRYLAAAVVAVWVLGAIPAFAFSSKYAGTYSSEAPAATDPKAPPVPSFSVSLGKDGSATVTQDPGKGATTTFGHWTESGSQITINFDAVDEHPADAPMVFQPAHDGLQAVTWNHGLWGNKTPPAMKKEDSNWHTGKRRGLL
jgi:hypothetical protein